MYNVMYYATLSDIRRSITGTEAVHTDGKNAIGHKR